MHPIAVSWLLESRDLPCRLSKTNDWCGLQKITPTSLKLEFLPITCGCRIWLHLTGKGGSSPTHSLAHSQLMLTNCPILWPATRICSQPMWQGTWWFYYSMMALWCTYRRSRWLCAAISSWPTFPMTIRHADSRSCRGCTTRSWWGTHTRCVSLIRSSGAAYYITLLQINLDVYLADMERVSEINYVHRDWMLTSVRLSSEDKMYACCSEAYQTVR